MNYLVIKKVCVIDKSIFIKFFKNNLKTKLLQPFFLHSIVLASKNTYFESINLIKLHGSQIAFVVL